MTKTSAIVSSSTNSETEASVNSSQKANQDCVACPSEKDEPCCVVNLLLSCQHRNKQYDFMDPSNPTNKIKVIADDMLKINLMGDSCKKGYFGPDQNQSAPGSSTDPWPIVHLSKNGGSTSQYQTDNSIVYGRSIPNHPITIAEESWHPDLKTFFNTFLIPKAEPDHSYTGKVIGCQNYGHYDFTVDVYPQQSWEGEISFETGIVVETPDYDILEQKNWRSALKSFFSRKDKYKVEQKAQFALGIELKGTKNSQDWTFSSEPGNFETGLGANNFAFKSVQSFFEKAIPNLGKLANSDLVEIKAIWPKIKISGKAELVEDPYDYGKLTSQSNIDLAFSPLFGISANTDILNWIILYATGGAGKVIIKLKKKAAKGVGSKKFGGKVKISIMLNAGGAILGKISFKEKAENWDTSGEIGVDVDFSIKGTAEAEVRTFNVSVSAGASMEGKTGLVGKLYGDTANDIGVGGYVEFTGLTIEQIVYASAGGSAIEPADKEEEKKDEEDKKFFDVLIDKFTTTRLETKKNKTFDVIDSAVLLGSKPGEGSSKSAPMAITDGGLGDA